MPDLYSWPAGGRLMMVSHMMKYTCSIQMPQDLQQP